MNNFEISLIRSLLKNTIEEIIILNKGKCTDLDGKQPIKIRFKDKVRQQMYYHPTIQIMKEALLDLIDIKLSRDIDYIRKLLTETYNELKESGTFNTLHKLVKEDHQEENDENDLISDYVKNINLLATFEEKLKKDTEASNLYVKQLDEEILDLENKIHDNRIENGMRTRLVEKWEQTRHEQEEVILENREKDLNEQCDNIQRKINIELRAINDIEIYITHRVQNIESQIAYWMEKYDTEVEQLDDDIQLTKENISEMIQKNEELQQIYAKRQEEINNYWHEKNMQKAALELEEKKWRNAIKIQAWWRGTMVRKGLGKYKRKKKGKGKGKKGKK